MTKKKDLKNRIRQRQTKTGESYTAARLQVRKERPAQTPLIAEAPDATPEARAQGLRCTAVVSAQLRATGDLQLLFARLRQLLEGLDADACGPLLRGEPAGFHLWALRDAVEARRFLADVEAGTRGLSGDGRLFALSWQGRTVVGSIYVTGSRTPLLYLGFVEEAAQAPLPPLAGIRR